GGVAGLVRGVIRIVRIGRVSGLVGINRLVRVGGGLRLRLGIGIRAGVGRAGLGHRDGGFAARDAGRVLGGAHRVGNHHVVGVLAHFARIGRVHGGGGTFNGHAVFVPLVGERATVLRGGVHGKRDSAALLHHGGNKAGRNDRGGCRRVHRH